MDPVALHVAQVAVHTLLAASHMCGCRDELEQHAYNTMHAYTGVSQPLHREDLPQVGPRVQAPIAPRHRVGVFDSPLHLRKRGRRERLESGRWTR